MPRFTRRCIWFHDFQDMANYFDKIRGEMFGKVTILGYAITGKHNSRKVKLQLLVRHERNPHKLRGWSMRFLTYRGPWGYPLNYNCNFPNFSVLGHRYRDCIISVRDIAERIYEKVTHQHKVAWLLGLRSPNSSVYRFYKHILCDFNNVPREIFKFLKF